MNITVLKMYFRKNERYNFQQKPQTMLIELPDNKINNIELDAFSKTASSFPIKQPLTQKILRENNASSVVINELRKTIKERKRFENIC